jgi:hypothetical protein
MPLGAKGDPRQSTIEMVRDESRNRDEGSGMKAGTGMKRPRIKSIKLPRVKSTMASTTSVETAATRASVIGRYRFTRPPWVTESFRGPDTDPAPDRIADRTLNLLN